MSPVKKIKRRLFKYLPVIKVGMVIAVAIPILLIFIYLSKFVSLAFKSNLVSPQSIYSVMFKNEQDIKQNKGRTNFLILGTGDANHDGPNLTDTIIFVSIEPKTKDIFMLPIPRDIWSEELKDKINSAYAYGESKKKGGGLILAKAAVSEVVGQPIHYAARINFSVFVEAIDLLGGINVNVENVIDDNKYPIAGKENEKCPDEDKEFSCRYTHIHFDKGLQHMDGKTALEFVRSRYAEGSEGTDFARSQRQLNVIQAIKAKGFSLKTITDQTLLSNILNALLTNIDTDLASDEITLLSKIALNLKDANIRHGVLDWGDENNKREGLLVNPPLDDYEGTWVLIPSAGNWDKIHDYVQSQISSSVTVPTPTPL